MNQWKYIFLTIIQLVKQAWLRPHPVAHSHEQRRRWQVVRKEHKSERLDRLQNPSKYLRR
jgi:hypothetical protein